MESTTSQPIDDALNLGTSLTIADVTEVYGKLLASLESKDVALDGSKVKRIDACGAQLILSFLRTRNAKELSTPWSGVSKELVAAFDDLGLDVECPRQNGETV